MSIKALFLTEEEMNLLEYSLKEIIDCHDLTFSETDILMKVLGKCESAITGKSEDVVCSHCGQSGRVYQYRLFGD